MKSTIISILFGASVGLVLSDPDCPPADLIRPCTCSNNELNCKGILNGQELVKVFEKIPGYSLSVRIESSTLQYIPHDTFNNVTVKYLFIQTTTLIQVFDAPPTTLNTLEQLYILDSKILRKRWDHFGSLTQLKVLFFQGTDVGVLDETFGRSLPKNLENLAIHVTKIKSIKPGAFRALEKLNVLSISEANLKTLTRNMFPTPFNGEFLLFSKNNLTSIPGDLFTQMPKLQVIDLTNNELTTIPEQAFDGRAPQLGALMLDDNSLHCDCSLEWMVKNKPQLVSGECQEPAKLKGKWLISLTEDDFNC